MTRVRLCYHDRCFDGTASAALFYRFYRECFETAAEFGFTGMTHRAKQPWEEGLFDGDENAIVDFKYSNSSKVTWWFDHHQSAFLTPADALQFREHPGRHMYYDPTYKSCTKFIATVANEKFGFDISPLADQECAGALMWVWVTFAYLGPAAFVTVQLLSPQRRAFDVEVV